MSNTDQTIPQPQISNIEEHKVDENKKVKRIKKKGFKKLQTSIFEN